MLQCYRPVRRALTRSAGAAAAKQLGWSDDEVAAHMQAVVVPTVAKEGLAPAAAAERFADALAELHGLDCFVWTKAWAAALEYFTPAHQTTKHKNGRRRRLSGRAAEDVEEAAQILFDRCVASGVEPNSYVYSRLVQAQATYKNCRIAFDFMVLDGTTPDEECVLSVLDMCARYHGTARHKAESLMSFLAHEGLVPTQAVWDRLLRIYSVSGDLPGASDVLLRMKEAGVALGPETYAHFLKVCSRSPASDYFETAELAVAQCMANGIELTPVALAKLMRIYRRQRHVKRGKALYRTASERRPASSELLWEYSRLLAKATDAASRKEAQRLRVLVRRRYTATLKKADTRRYAAFLKLRAAAAKRRRNRPARATRKKKASHRPADLISEAIERHLSQQRKAKEEAGKAKGEEERTTDSARTDAPHAQAVNAGGVRTGGRAKVVRIG